MRQLVYFLSFILIVPAVKAAGCLDKSEIVLSEATTFGACVLKEKLEVRTKQLYCDDTLLDEWDYWAGLYEQKETKNSKVLVQITNTCTGKLVSSETVNRKSLNTGSYYISDTRSLYPSTYNWYVTRGLEGVDYLQVGDCDSFRRLLSNDEPRSSRKELLSESQAREYFASEKEGCESNQK